MKKTSPSKIAFLENVTSIAKSKQFRQVKKNQNVLKIKSKIETVVISLIGYIFFICLREYFVCILKSFVLGPALEFPILLAQ